MPFVVFNCFFVSFVVVVVGCCCCFRISVDRNPKMASSLNACWTVCWQIRNVKPIFKPWTWTCTKAAEAQPTDPSLISMISFILEHVYLNETIDGNPVFSVGNPPKQIYILTFEMEPAAGGEFRWSASWSVEKFIQIDQMVHVNIGFPIWLTLWFMESTRSNLRCWKKLPLLGKSQWASGSALFRLLDQGDGAVTLDEFLGEGWQDNAGQQDRTWSLE